MVGTGAMLLLPLSFGLAGATVVVDKKPTWADWIPRTDAWRARLDYRAEQVARIEANQERFDALLNLAATGLLVPNFTAVGYQVVKTPRAVHDMLNASLVDAFRNGKVVSEHHVDQIAGPDANFVHLGKVARDAQKLLHPLHEAWAGGIKLKAATAYGLRLYQPTNTLTMHTDRLETHVISSIVHVDRDLDEPWPIVIEGFDGTTVEVDLQPGEMLFYESAKCIHGRPRPMKGRWYTSLFVHFYPAGWDVTMKDAISIIEPFWEKFTKHPDSQKYDTLRLTGTGYYEPDCPNNWCGLSPVWPPLNVTTVRDAASGSPRQEEDDEEL